MCFVLITRILLILVTISYKSSHKFTDYYDYGNYQQKCNNRGLSFVVLLNLKNYLFSSTEAIQLTYSPGAYFKCSIRGTNDQLPNMFYKLFIFNCFNIKHKTVHLQFVWRQIFVFQKPCLSDTKENGCLWTYGRSPLDSDFKLTRENDEL